MNNYWLHYIFLAFSLEGNLQSSAMDIPVLKVKELQWRISMRQGYLKLMVRWLPFLEFLMVFRCHFSDFFFTCYSKQQLTVLHSFLIYMLSFFKSMLITVVVVLWIYYLSIWWVLHRIPFSISGHGGARTAEYLKNNLFKNLSSHPDFIKDTKAAIGINNFQFFLIQHLDNILYFILDIFCVDSQMGINLLLQLKFSDRRIWITLMKRMASKKMLGQLHQLLCF